jgi:soluble calcium-activated nucleotidase 1
VALKSAENAETGKQTTFITVFDRSGNVLLEETEVPGEAKFEGIEFVSW